MALTVEQHELLQTLSDELVAAYLRELKPSLWPGGDQEHTRMSQQERGDRFWAKRNAYATGQLIMQSNSILNNAALTPTNSVETSKALEAFEERATRALAIVK